jgi:hypothetical protein
MGQDKKTPITINEKEYQYEDLTAEQQTLFNHCIDLDRKISSTAFNLDQMQVGKQAFFKLLEESLAKAVEVPADVVATPVQ